ncbi:MAG: hypothetical protein DME23_23955 [Verrucomicrobia bacterium]|nr:MAG: hypothetical protein DME23_23955 [Verrucomicrobiota bacterium]
MRICINTTACSPHQNPQLRLEILRNAHFEQHGCQCGRPEKGHRKIWNESTSWRGSFGEKLRSTSSLLALWQGFSK